MVLDVEDLDHATLYFRVGIVVPPCVFVFGRYLSHSIPMMRRFLWCLAGPMEGWPHQNGCGFVNVWDVCVVFDQSQQFMPNHAQ